MGQAGESRPSLRSAVWLLLNVVSVDITSLVHYFCGTIFSRKQAGNRQRTITLFDHYHTQNMDFCLSCQKFSLHRFSRAPDQACPFKLSAIEQGAREGCALCSFFSQQIQPILISFEVHPSKCWMRLVIPRRSDIDTDRTSGLGLSEIEVYLVNHPLETKTEQRSQSIFLGLAATPSA